MSQTSLRLYAFISRLRRPKSYQGKILLIAFLGTHVPLIGLIFYLFFAKFTLSNAMSILAIALVATLLGTAITLYALHKLLSPIKLTSQALRSYIDQSILPDLPIQYRDEVGTLMADTQQTLHQLNEVVEYAKNYDYLTGLPNRDLFQIQLQQAIDSASQKHLQLAVILLDLVGLKEVNSSLGRRVGDLLLRKVTRRITNCLEETDFLARLGGGEFALLRTELKNADLPSLSHRLLHTLSQPFSLYEKEVQVGANLGITIYPFDGTSVEQLLQNADTAIHEAKQQARNTYQFYVREMNAKLQKRLALEEQLRYALRRGELFLHYQPRVNLSNGRVVGVEALLRWENPLLGSISPAEFIPIAEENGQIIAIGEWVLRSACLQNRLWQQEGFPPLRMSVNLSGRQFKQETLIDTIDQILTETGINVAYLELEVTESLLIEDVQQAIDTLGQLKNRGIKLSLDDFGTGYSSLNYLQKFPIDILKIDRSFVSDVACNPDDAAIARAIIALAHSLQLDITAEGIETNEQLNYLKEQGCHEGQGYYFSKPLSVYGLTNFLATMGN